MLSATAWTIKLLSEVAKIQKGTTITAKATRPGRVPVIAGGMKPAYFHDEANRPENAITVSASGAAGYLSFHPYPIFASDCITVETLDPNVLDQKYLFLCLLSMQDRIYSFSRGTALQHVYAKDLATIEIPFPPLNDQKRIVEALDENLTGLERALADLQHSEVLAKQLLASAMSTAFSDLGATKRAIGTFGDVKGGKRLPKGTPWSSTFTDHPYIRSTDIKRGRIDEDNLVYVPDQVWPSISRYTVNEGDVLVTIAGTIGETGVVTKRLHGANLTENAAKIVASREVVEPHFLEMYLRTPEVYQEMQFLARATTQPKLALYRIQEILVPLPGLNDQREALLKLHRIQEAHHLSVTRTRKLKSEILQLRRSLLFRTFKVRQMKGSDGD
jgi:type I restriction enzyme S subunit